MGVLYNPKVVTSNLVFCLDACNKNSYPGTGTSCYNLINKSHTGNMAYLVGGTTASTTSYSANNGGIFSMGAGTKDYIDFGALDLGIEAANKTLCAWIYPTSFPSLTGIVDRNQDGGGGYGFWMNGSGKLWYWPRGFGDVVDTGSYSVSLNTWNYVIVSYTISTKAARFYYNGNFSSQLTSTGTEIAPSGTYRLNIGSTRNAGEASFGGGFFKGAMGPVQIYNRVLSDNEVKQNFNALRGRFGV